MSTELTRNLESHEERRRDFISYLFVVIGIQRALFVCKELKLNMSNVDDSLCLLSSCHSVEAWPVFHTNMEE